MSASTCRTCARWQDVTPDKRHGRCIGGGYHRWATPWDTTCRMWTEIPKPPKPPRKPKKRKPKATKKVAKATARTPAKRPIQKKARRSTPRPAPKAKRGSR